MVDMHSATAEIRRGKNIEDDRRKKPQDESIMACPIRLLHRAARPQQKLVATESGPTVHTLWSHGNVPGSGPVSDTASQIYPAGRF